LGIIPVCAGTGQPSNSFACGWLIKSRFPVGARISLTTTSSGLTPEPNRFSGYLGLYLGLKPPELEAETILPSNNEAENVQMFTFPLASPLHEVTYQKNNLSFTLPSI
jgi:hypothetical protein